MSIAEACARHYEDTEARAEPEYMTDYEKWARKAEIIRECRLELAADNARAEQREIERADKVKNSATQDDYEMVASLDHLEPGGFK